MNERPALRSAQAPLDVRVLAAAKLPSGSRPIAHLQPGTTLPKMRTWMSLFVSATLAGCQAPTLSSERQGEGATSQPNQKPRVERPHAQQVSSLAGEWRVAAIDGLSLDQPVGLALRGTETEIWWDPRCAGLARRYRIEGSKVSFNSIEPPRQVREPTRPVCTIGLPPKLGQVFDALDGASSVSRTESNGILIAGAKHSVLLFSQ